MCFGFKISQDIQPVAESYFYVKRGKMCFTIITLSYQLQLVVLRYMQSRLMDRRRQSSHSKYCSLFAHNCTLDAAGANE